MKKILIVDDEKRVSDLYARVFSGEGFLVKNAVSAREATWALIRENFDMILLDIKMPEVDGRLMYEIARDYNPKIKVIVSSVCSVNEQAKNIIGACAYHDKAQGVGSLIEKVKGALDDDREEKNTDS